MSDALNRIFEYAETVASQSADPQRRAQIQVQRVALGLSDEVGALDEIPVEQRLSALLTIADLRPSPPENLRDRIAETVTSLAAREHETVVALALWAGLDLEASGFSGLPAIYRAKTAQRLARTAALAETGALVAWINAQLPSGPGRDLALVAAIEARRPTAATLSALDERARASAVKRWITASAGIQDPLARAQSLLRLAPAMRGSSASMGACERMAFTLAQGAYERLRATAGRQRWRGAAAALFGGLAGPVDPGLAARLLADAWQQLQAVERLVVRSEALGVLLEAETQRGLEPWQKAVTAVGEDLRMKAEPAYWVALVRELPSTVAEVALREGESLGEDELKPLRAMIQKIRVPQHRALAFAQYAEVVTNIAGGDPGPALQQVASSLRSTQDPRWRQAIWHDVARGCGRASIEAARDMTKLGRDASEKVNWLMALSVVASRPTDTSP